MGNTHQQESSIQAVQSVTGSISIIACIVMSYKVSKERKSNIANRMLAYLLFIDSVLALFYAVGRAGMENEGFCKFQGLMIQWFSVVAFFWVVLMAYQMHEWIVKKKNTKKIEKAVNRSMGMIFVVSGIMAFSLLGAGMYDDTYMWCWITSDQMYLRLFCFDIILIVAWIITIFVLREVSVSLTSRVDDTSIDARIGDLLSSSSVIQRKLVLYVLLFVVMWSSVLLNRLLEMGVGHPVYVTSMIQAVVLPLQGFVNALCYGGYLDNLQMPWEAIKTKMTMVISHIAHHHDRHSHANTNSEVMVDSSKARVSEASNAKLIPGFVPKVYSIFTTTLNMGEASTQSIQADLKEWILEGHDIYAVGLQECIDLVGIRSVILDHLGGPTKYAMFTTEIGSGNTRLGYHGFIALTVYVKVSELKEGHIHPTKPSSETMATGTDLLVTTAQNKGAVGLPFQIHDTNIGFVTCHLPSDSKGKSKLSKRNASAHSILKEVTLAPEDLGFDLHLQHDHLLVFGDLNYRMETNQAGVNSLTGVAVASLIEKNVMNDDPHWLHRKYNMLRSYADPLHPSLEELKLLKLAKSNSKGAWTSVLRADELRSIMDDGDAFSGFEEPMPCFAPSYKRRKGTVEGDCGDYTDPTKIISGFSNTGNIESEMAYQKTVQELQKTNSGHNILPGGRKISVVPSMIVDTRRRDSPGMRERSSTFTAEDRMGENSSPQKSQSLDLSDMCEQVETTEDDGSERGSDYEYRDSDTSKKYPIARRRGAAVLQTTPVETAAPKKPVDPRKLRPPSYTDRILIHSLPDRHNRLTVQAYDLCDLVRISDHRAVSMTLKLQVNGAVDYKTPNSTVLHDIRKEPKFDLFELSISNIVVKLGVDDAAEDSDEDDDEEEVSYRDTEDSVVAEPMTNPLHLPKGGTSRPNSINLDHVMSPGTSLGTVRSSVLEVEMSSSFLSSSHISVSTQQSASNLLTLPPRKARFEEESSDSAATSRDFADSTISAVNDIEANNNNVSNSNNNSSAPDSKRNSRKKSMFGFALSTTEDDDGGVAEDKPRPVSTGRPVSISRSPSARKKSLFAFSSKQEPPNEEAEDAIFKEMAADSLAWKSEPGEWRKRVQEENRRRKEERIAAGNNSPQVMISKLNHQVKKTKKKRSNDKIIDQLTVVFPLPSKDPLLTHRKLYDFSQAFGKLGADLVKIEKEMAQHAKNIAEPISLQDSNVVVTKEDLLRPMAVFNWPLRDSKKKNEVPGQSGTSKVYKVQGCASPELGAHVLLKLVNKSGYDLGTCVVCLSHLINRDPAAFYSTEFTNLELSSGGQKRGEISGKFSLKFIPSPLSSGE